MERITKQIYAEAIEKAFSLIGPSLGQRLYHVHFFCGVDPVWAGLHSYISIKDGRSYRNTAHVCFPWNAINPRERTTIVLPLPEDASPYVIVHELGHCLDEVLGFSHTAKPINEYAMSTHLEAFAEAFAAQWFWFGEREEDIAKSDTATKALFEQLQGE